MVTVLEEVSNDRLPRLSIFLSDFRGRYLANSFMRKPGWETVKLSISD